MSFVPYIPALHLLSLFSSGFSLTQSINLRTELSIFGGSRFETQDGGATRTDPRENSTGMESRAVPKASKELDSAIEDDRKYKEVDSAKKRAVAQRVDYDTFKNLVSVAHLKPLQAPDEIVRGALRPTRRVQRREALADTSLTRLVSSARNERRSGLEIQRARFERGQGERAKGRVDFGSRRWRVRGHGAAQDERGL